MSNLPNVEYWYEDEDPQDVNAYRYFEDPDAYVEDDRTPNRLAVWFRKLSYRGVHR